MLFRSTTYRDLVDTVISVRDDLNWRYVLEVLARHPNTRRVIFLVGSAHIRTLLPFIDSARFDVTRLYALDTETQKPWPCDPESVAQGVSKTVRAINNWRAGSTKTIDLDDVARPHKCDICGERY